MVGPKTLEEAEAAYLKARHSFYTALAVGFAPLWILLTYLTIVAVADLQLNSSFNRRLTIVLPKLSDQEHKEFLASWAAMTTRRDYQQLNTRLEDVAKARGVKLPKPLLP
jgi:hypothetical protein